MKTLQKPKTASPVGIIRKIDKLGRIVLPMEFRKNLNIGENDDVEMCMYDDGTIMIQKKEIQS